MKTVDETSDEAPLPADEKGQDGPRQRTGLIPNFAELSKARLNTMVLGTTAVGFALAAPDLPAMKLFWTLAGTALTAASAGMLNQLAEIKPDGLMLRTRERPLPAGLVSPRMVFVLGVLLTYAGVTILGMKVNGISCVLALVNVLIYVLVYTPLKPRTTLNTLVGAICGAIPPMIGWVAASGRLDGGAWLLGTILFVWQLPHFFALALLYRDDYERGGFAMLPVVDNRGEITVQVILVTSLCLIPIGLGASLIGLAGGFYAITAIALGAMMSLLSLMLYVRRTRDAARRVFLGSLAYLPLLLGAMVIDTGRSAPAPLPEFTEPMNPHGTLIP